MSSILHRVSIDAAPESVQELVATTDGVEQWWTARRVGGNAGLGGTVEAYFGDSAEPAAVFEVVEQTPEKIVWLCVAGPDDWLGTRVNFEFKPFTGGGTTLLFSHEGWQAENEFMHGCSTNWGAYLASLKLGAEGRGFQPYPAGEISRWG